MDNGSKFSIITPSYQRAGLIKTAISSVLSQDCGFEHIIIDGGSIDGTLELLRGYPHLKVISEPDRGMYDALNKGIKISTGSFIGFLNTDDHYEPNIFGKVKNIFELNPDIDVVWGNADVRNFSSWDGSESYQRYMPPKEDKLISRLMVELPIFNACFFRRSIFAKFGDFLPDYKIAADREYMLRLALGDCRFYRTDLMSYHYLEHESSLSFSKSLAYREIATEEECKIAEVYLTRKTLLPKTANLFRRWHSFSTVSYLKVSIKNGHLKKAAAGFRNGLRYDFYFPVVFVQRVMGLLLHRSASENPILAM